MFIISEPERQRVADVGESDALLDDVRSAESSDRESVGNACGCCNLVAGGVEPGCGGDRDLAPRSGGDCDFPARSGVRCSVDLARTSGERVSAWAGANGEEGLRGHGEESEPAIGGAAVIESEHVPATSNAMAARSASALSMSCSAAARSERAWFNIAWASELTGLAGLAGLSTNLSGDDSCCDGGAEATDEVVARAAGEELRAGGGGGQAARAERGVAMASAVAVCRSSGVKA